jgi:hypothetical protein
VKAFAALSFRCSGTDPSPHLLLLPPSETAALVCLETQTCPVREQSLKSRSQENNGRVISPMRG